MNALALSCLFLCTPVKGASTEMQGVWKVVSVVLSGKAIMKGDDLECVIKDNTITLKGKDNHEETGSFKTSMIKGFIGIDITKKGGGLTRGILKIDRNTMTICWSYGQNKDRPTEFVSNPDTSTLLVILKRGKPSKQEKDLPAK